MKTAVIGAGSWGSALARLIALNGHETWLWSIDGAEVALLQEKHEQTEKLPGVRLPESIHITGDLQEAVCAAEICVIAVPSPHMRSVSKMMAPYVSEGQILVNAAKGIEEETLMTMSSVIAQEIPQAVTAVISGPSHAEEVGKDIPTAVVVAAKRQETAEQVRTLFANHFFRVYTSPDMLGVQLSGSIKNVIALAAGMADGLGCGDNTKAALITRGIAEISRLGTAMGADKETFSGLSGIGDLIVTCGSMHSRNRRAGILIGQGKTMEEAMEEVKMVVEGVYSAKAAKTLADHYHVSMPIVEEVNQCLFHEKTAKEALRDLMTRLSREEHAGMKWGR